jgi:parvulin-like peptidyl-prolyl isomerase
MAPGSYGISSVNDELNRLPIGQVSQVIEAAESFHIVRVDSRREKGPLHFTEVQDQVKMQVFMENTEKAIDKYLAKLRAKTLIKSMYVVTPEGLVESSAGAPESKKDPAVQPASVVK